MKKEPMTPRQWEKYYGEQEYHKKERALKASGEKIFFTEEQREIILRDMTIYIDKNDFLLYHDFMNDISISHPDWFNLLTFNKKSKEYILYVIKSRVQYKKRPHA